MLRTALRSAGVLAVVALCANVVAVRAAAPVSYAIKPGINLANIDHTCKACDDFYQFAVGNFPKNNPLPADRPAWGSFAILAQDNRNELHTILDDAAADTAAAPGSNEQKIGSYYRACMNEDAIEKAGLTPVQSLLDGVTAMQSPADVVTEGGRLGAAGVGGAFSAALDADNHDSRVQLVTLSPGRTGLDRDSLALDTPRSQTARAAYVTYIASLLTSAGSDAATAQTDAQNILALEVAFAHATPRRADLRDPALTYHPTAFASLRSVVPGVDWASFYTNAGFPPVDTVNVTLPATINAYTAQLSAAPIATWRAYYRFRVLDSFATTLPRAYADANFAFRGVALTGTKAQLPRWQRCVAATDGALGEALGQVYVSRAFSPAAKARALALVTNLQSVLADDIRNLGWMSAPTKQRAETKLAAFTKKIGYPDRFRDYSKLTVADGPFAANVIAVRAFQQADLRSRIGKPTDRARWGMTPPTVNAYYNPINNEIAFPAGILHPPFFSDANDDAVNYGAIGMVIGHEMTHGFDDQGRQYDENGNVSDWWTAADAAQFKTRAQCIIDEFSGFSEGDIHQEGKLVQGEAVADLGGITIAYRAFQKTAEYQAHKMIDGYTPEQRFFLAFAQVWAEDIRPEYAAQLSTTDPHPLNRFRVIGTLANDPDFQKAFGCVAADKMVRANACAIW